MTCVETQTRPGVGTSARFATTHWTVVRQAGGDGSTEAGPALEQLCHAYWYPLYAFARKRGAAPAEAQDLTQGFFAHLLRSKLVGKADPEAGKFRSFLLGSFKHFIAGAVARDRAQRPGESWRHFPIDGRSGELWFAAEVATVTTPESLFERAWAARVLAQALERLADEFRQAGREDLFEALYPLLQGERAERTYAELALTLGSSEGTIKVTVNRMRRRYRALIRSVIRDTVTSPAEVLEEEQHLIAVLRG